MTLHEALLARLRGAVDPVYDGEGKAGSSDPTKSRYAVLYVDVPALASDDVANTQRLLRSFPTVTAVGTSVQQALWVATRVRDALAGWVPAVDGWECGPVEHLSGGRVERDDDTKPPLFYLPSTFEIHASR